MELREYQKESIVQSRKAIMQGHKKIILSLATGAGKSIIAKNIVDMVNDKGGGVLYLAHRTLLIEQMCETLKDCNNVVVETIQSSKNRTHDDVKLLIVDEAHYGVNSPMQDKVLAKYPKSIVIGMTATPIMRNGDRIEGWDKVIDIVQLRDLIDLGFASPIKVLAPMGVDRSELSVIGGEYNQKQVGDLVTESVIVANVVDKYIEYGEDRRAIFYCINIDHAEMIAGELIAKGINASSYHSKMKNKKEVFNDFKSGELHVLASVDSLTTGIDLPDIYCLVLATPIKSIIKAVQIYGRGTRLDKNNPDKVALILDCANVIDDTIHPLSKMDFTKKGKKTVIECLECDGYMKTIKVKIGEIDKETGGYIETVTRKCDKCGAITIEEMEKVVELISCLECDMEIEKGTSTCVTVVEEDSVTIFTVCPHCGNKKEYRVVETMDAVLKEKLVTIDMAECGTWEDVHVEFMKAKDKYGKKYHHIWATKAIEGLKEEGFTISEVTDFVRFYVSKGWAIGGIVTAMKKRRN